MRIVQKHQVIPPEPAPEKEKKEEEKEGEEAESGGYDSATLRDGNRISGTSLLSLCHSAVLCPNWDKQQSFDRARLPALNEN
ncbi:hypothetical protein JZ751_000983 [Albula glossodonta]|uniref:Uncharacterized protein n=1 Tax=Albula glossodonta TaxID=121402 RepID=A0A8T2PXL2_9TELE|nr:hypothetical protein JZ751_000983 [Albula glossodonta]